MRTSYILTLFPIATIATVMQLEPRILNGHCTGSAATGVFGEDGICVSTTTCSSFHGETTTNACPSDPVSVKCCVIGLGNNGATNPCGGVSWCDWTANGCPGGAFHAGMSYTAFTGRHWWLNRCRILPWGVEFPVLQAELSVFCNVEIPTAL